MNMIFLLLGSSLLFSLFIYSIGRSLPVNWLLPNIKIPVQQCILGFSIAIVVMRLPYREDLPIYPFILLIYFLAAIGLLKIVKSKVKSKKEIQTDTFQITSIDAAFGAFALLILSAPVLLPLVAKESAYIQYIGPDLDGHLMSAALFSEQLTRGNHLAYLIDAIGTSKWWSLQSAWNLPDFREAVGLEFVLRSNRYGHAVLSSLISHVSSQQIWFGMLVLVLSSTWATVLVVHEKFFRAPKTNLFPLGVTFLLICFSQTYVIMLYEGIIGQLVCTNLVIFLILNIDIFIKNKLSIGQVICTSVILSAVSSTFGEGLQILVIFVGMCSVILMIQKIIITYPKNINFEIDLIKNLVLISVSFVLISPAVFVDFLTWSYFRFRQNFAGGILHLDWDLYSLLFSIPVFFLNSESQGWRLLFTGQPISNLIEIIVLIGFLFFLKRFYRKMTFEDLAIGIAALLTIVIFIATNHKYALWKCVVLLQPLIIYKILISGLTVNNTIIYKCGLGVVLVMAVAGWGILLTQYHRFGTAVPSQDYVLSSKRKDIALLMPSNSQYYLKLGASSPLYLLNKPGWSLRQPNFNIRDAANLKIALFFSCGAEGNDRCNQIISNNKLNLSPGQLYVTDLLVSSVINSDGSVDTEKIRHLVKEKFGVEEVLRF
jgi:hypothetical protein